MCARHCLPFLSVLCYRYGRLRECVGLSIRKLLAGLLCFAFLTLFPLLTLADSWDFLHAAVKIFDPEILVATGAANDLDVLPSPGLSGVYEASGLSLAGLTPQCVTLQQQYARPYFDCMIDFDIASGATVQDPGPEFTALLTALTEKYGTPLKGDSVRSLEQFWFFTDATIGLSWDQARLGTDVSGAPLQLLFSRLAVPEMAEAQNLGALPLPPNFSPAEAIPDPNAPFAFHNGIKGGMTVAEVIAYEGREPDYQIDTGLFYYNKTFAGLPAMFGYTFHNGALDSFTCSLVAIHEDLNLYINDYQTVKAALVEQYGPAYYDTESWQDSQYKDSPDQYGAAVRCGALTYNAAWLLNDAQFQLTLRGENNMVQLYLYHMFKETGPLR